MAGTGGRQRDLALVQTLGATEPCHLGEGLYLSLFDQVRFLGFRCLIFSSGKDYHRPAHLWAGVEGYSSEKERYYICFSSSVDVAM